MIAQTLPGRLLCAANLAYGDSASVATSRYLMAGYMVGAGLEAWKTITSSDGVNEALVGTSPDGIIVAFRGTLAIDDKTQTIGRRIYDWGLDFDDNLLFAVGLPGKVHTGFYCAVKSIWEQVKIEIAIQRNKLGGDAKLYFTGHSKGGGMAPIAAAMLGDSTSRVVTFAAPKCGDARFRDACKLDMVRYEYRNDMVPLLPELEYEHCGNLIYRDAAGRIMAERDKGLATIIADAVIGVDAESLFSDHHICRDSGYWNWLCPEVGA